MVKDKAQESDHKYQGQVIENKVDALTNHTCLSIYIYIYINMKNLILLRDKGNHYFLNFYLSRTPG